MPLGLANTPAILQRLVNDVQRHMINTFVFVYLDDILVLSQSLAKHADHVHAMLKCLLQNHLYVKAKKCELHKSTARNSSCLQPSLPPHLFLMMPRHCRAK